MSNLETIKQIYDAFGRGDIPAILEKLSDNVEFESWADNYGQRSDIPWLQHRRGKDGVMDFFGVVAGMEITRFNVLALMEGPDRVSAEIEITTKYFSDEEIHLWNFDADGKVVRMRHYIDTAKHIEGFRKVG